MREKKYGLRSIPIDLEDFALKNWRSHQRDIIETYYETNSEYNRMPSGGIINYKVLSKWKKVAEAITELVAESSGIEKFDCALGLGSLGGAIATVIDNSIAEYRSYFSEKYVYYIVKRPLLPNPFYTLLKKREKRQFKLVIYDFDAGGLFTVAATLCFIEVALRMAEEKLQIPDDIANRIEVIPIVITMRADPSIFTDKVISEYSEIMESTGIKLDIRNVPIIPVSIHSDGKSPQEDLGKLTIFKHIIIYGYHYATLAAVFGDNCRKYPHIEGLDEFGENSHDKAEYAWNRYKFIFHPEIGGDFYGKVEEALAEFYGEKSNYDEFFKLYRSVKREFIESKSSSPISMERYIVLMIGNIIEAIKYAQPESITDVDISYQISNIMLLVKSLLRYYAPDISIHFIHRLTHYLVTTFTNDYEMYHIAELENSRNIYSSMAAIYTAAETIDVWPLLSSPKYECVYKNAANKIPRWTLLVSDTMGGDIFAIRLIYTKKDPTIFAILSSEANENEQKQKDIDVMSRHGENLKEMYCIADLRFPSDIPEKFSRRNASEKIVALIDRSSKESGLIIANRRCPIPDENEVKKMVDVFLLMNYREE